LEPQPADSLEAVRAAICARIIELSDEPLSAEEIDAGEPLFDAGYLDSMSSAALLEYIASGYGVEIQEVELVGRLSTLDALTAHVYTTTGLRDA